MKMDNPELTIENDVLKGAELSCPNDFASLGKFILERLEDNRDFIGLIDATTGEEWSYGKIRDRSVGCALWMRSQGVRPGDVVVTCFDHCPDFMTPSFAALYLGATFSPWSVAMKTAEYRHYAKIVKPRMIFVSESVAATVTEAIEKEKLDSEIVVFGQTFGALEFESIIALAGDEEVKNFKCAVIESTTDIAAILFSSGTTALPKGVALSHESFLRQMYLQSDKVSKMGGKVVSTFGAPHWITTILITFGTLFLNSPRILTPPFEEDLACSLIEKYQVNWLFLSPAMINGLLKSDALRRYNISSLTRVIYGGAPLPETSHEALVKLLPKAVISAVYGMTELGGYVSFHSNESKLANSCGRIVNNVQLKVIDPETGRTLGVDQRGELLLKTPFMMNFYYGDPDATAKAVDEQGWLHSGDLGYYQQNGGIFIIERLKELIKYRNNQISPSEIENVLLSHPDVKEASVVSVPHYQDDEHPVAFVVRSNDSTKARVCKQVTESELIDLVAVELSDCKRLRGGVRFVDRLPKTSTGKVLRKTLRDLAKSKTRSD